MIKTLKILIIISVFACISGCLRPPDQLSSGISSIDDDLIFATAAPDNILVYSIRSGKMKSTLPADVRLNDMAIDEKKMLAYVVTKNGWLNVFNLNRGDQIDRVRIGTILQSVALSADGKYLAIGVGNEVDYNVKDFSIRYTSDIKKEARLVALRGDIQDLVANPVRNELYVLNTNADKVRVFNFDTLELQNFLILGGSPSSFQVSLDGSKIYATLNARNAVIVLDAETREIIRRHELTGSVPHYIAFSPDNKLVAVTDRDQSRIFFIDNENDVLLGYKSFPEDMPRSLYPEMIAFSSDSKYLYIVSGRENIFAAIDIEYMQMVQNYSLPKIPCLFQVIWKKT